MTYLRPFLIGFVFGTLGLWILAMLSLALQPVEQLATPLFGLGRWLGSQLAPGGNGSTGVVMIIMLINGLFYGAIGVAIDSIIRKMRKKSS